MTDDRYLEAHRAVITTSQALVAVKFGTTGGYYGSLLLRGVVVPSVGSVRVVFYDGEDLGSSQAVDVDLPNPGGISSHNLVGLSALFQECADLVAATGPADLAKVDRDAHGVPVLGHRVHGEAPINATQASASVLAVLNRSLRPYEDRGFLVIGWLLVRASQVRYYLFLTDNGEVIGVDYDLSAQQQDGKFGFVAGTALDYELPSLIKNDQLKFHTTQAGDDYCERTYSL